MDTIKSVNTKEEIKRTADLAYHIWNEYFIPIIGKAQVDYMLDKFQSERAISEMISNGYRYYMIFSNGEPAGYCGVRLEDKGRLFLSKLYVKKEFRKKGFSRKMLQNAISDNAPVNTVYLTVNKYNDSSIAIYKHFGFKIKDAVVSDIDGGFVMDDYIMELGVEN